MRDDLSGLTALLLVAEKRSFTAAAASLHVTPSAVSQTVRALEARVGVRLLQRTTRSVGLTEAGAVFVAQLKPALGAVQDALRSLGKAQERPSGVVRLTVPRFGYQQVLAPKLKAFLAAYPEIDLEVSVDDAFVDIVAEGFDAGMRIGESIDREMIGVRVGEDWRMVVVGAPSYFATRGKPRHPRDLAAHECIGYRRRTTGTRYRWEFTERGRELAVTVRGRLVLDDADLMRDAAIEGHGLAYLPEPHLRAELAAGRLESVLDAFCEPFPGLFLYYPSRTHLAPKLQALVTFLRWSGRPPRRTASRRTSEPQAPKVPPTARGARRRAP